MSGVARPFRVVRGRRRRRSPLLLEPLCRLFIRLPVDGGDGGRALELHGEALGARGEVVARHREPQAEGRRVQVGAASLDRVPHQVRGIGLKK